MLRRPTCAAHYLKPVTPHPKGTPPSVGPSWLYRILTPPPINLPDLGLITTPISKHGHPNPGTRSPCSLAGQRLHRLGRLGSQVCTCNRTPRPHALSQCPHFFWKCTGAPAYVPHHIARLRKQWHIPTLLRNRAFQTHPRARRGGRRRRAHTSLTGLARPSRGAPLRGTESAIIRSTAAYTASDVLHAALTSLQAIPPPWIHAGALHRYIRPEPYSMLLLQLVSQTARCVCHCAQAMQHAGQTRHLLTAVQRHTYSCVEDKTQHDAAATKDTHTHTHNPPGHRPTCM